MTWSARGDAVRMDLMRCRHRLFEAALASWIRFDDGQAWTQRHRDWLATVTLDCPAAQATLLDARGAIDALAHRRDRLEREIVTLQPSSPWVAQVGRLRCLRGIDALGAVGSCAEIGDFERFERFEQLPERHCHGGRAGTRRWTQHHRLRQPGWNGADLGFRLARAGCGPLRR